MDEIRRLDLSKYNEDSEEGLIQEVALEYPRDGISTIAREAACHTRNAVTVLQGGKVYSVWQQAPQADPKSEE